MTARGRVATFLLDLAARHGAAGPIDLQMSRQDIADYLGLSVETVCRVLSRFAEAGFIAIPDVSQVEIVEAAALRAIRAGPEC